MGNVKPIEHQLHADSAVVSQLGTDAIAVAS